MSGPGGGISGGCVTFGGVHCAGSLGASVGPDGGLWMFGNCWWCGCL